MQASTSGKGSSKSSDQLVSRVRRGATVGVLVVGTGVVGWTLVELTGTPAPRPSVVQSALPSPMPSLASAAKARRRERQKPEPHQEIPAATPEPARNPKKPRLATKLIRGGDLEVPGQADPYVVKTFRLSVYEITVGEYRRCVDAGACSEPRSDKEHCHWGQEGKDRFPINCVSFVDADQFCSWLGMHVPTEFEWQWAAQGREQARRFPWGSTPEADCSRVVMSGQDRDCAPNGLPMRVGSRPRGATRDGIMDMSGNVWEWTSSSYTEGSSHKSLRGGSAQHASITMFATTKRAPLIVTTNVHFDGGFRCAK